MTMHHTIIVFTIFWQAVPSGSVSYNLPSLSNDVRWAPQPTLFVNKTMVGRKPSGIFIDKNDTIYITSHDDNSVTVWHDGAKNYSRRLTLNLSKPHDVFVTDMGDIYVDSGANEMIVQWSSNSLDNPQVIPVDDICYGLFVGLYESIYCSQGKKHRVVKISKKIPSNLTRMAGEDKAGATSELLNEPLGIFVDDDLTLYVSDCKNNRIQSFKSSEKTGSTVAGKDSSAPFQLSCPSSVVLDKERNLFIMDSGSQRIVKCKGRPPVRCSVQEFGLPATIAPKISDHSRLSFDRQGNIYFTSHGADAVYKLSLLTNSSNTTTAAVTTVLTTSSTVASNDCSNTAMISSSCFFGHPVQHIEFDVTTNCTTSTIHSTQLTTVTSAALITTVKKDNISVPASPAFAPNSCGKPEMIGENCQISASPCDVIGPCDLYKSCSNGTGLNPDPRCSCLKNFSVSICKSIEDPCQSYFCSHGGKTRPTDGSCHCDCPPSRNGSHCELKVDLCRNLTCLNGGICFLLEDRAECQCLGSNYYSGKHCEIVATKLKVFQFVSKSVSWVAIIIFVAFVLFIVIMDVLKYGFGIDPVAEEREKLRAERRKRQRRAPVIQRFVYVN